MLLGGRNFINTALTQNCTTFSIEYVIESPANTTSLSINGQNATEGSYNALTVNGSITNLCIPGTYSFFIKTEDCYETPDCCSF